MVILCMKFYGLLSEIVLSHDNQNDIELVRFSVVCNVHNIIIKQLFLIKQLFIFMVSQYKWK